MSCEDRIDWRRIELGLSPEDRQKFRQLGQLAESCLMRDINLRVQLNGTFHIQAEENAVMTLMRMHEPDGARWTAGTSGGAGSGSDACAELTF